MTKVSAKMGKDKDAKSVTVEYDIPEDLKGLRERFGDKVVAAHVNASVTIALQSFLRGQLKADKSPADIQKAVNEWKPGVRAPGKSAVDKAKDALEKLSPEERSAVLAAIKQQQKAA